MTEVPLDPEQIERLRQMIEAGDEQGIIDYLMEEVDLFGDDEGIDQPLPGRYDETDNRPTTKGDTSADQS